MELHELGDTEFHDTFEGGMQEVPDHELPDVLLDAYMHSWLEIEGKRHKIDSLELEYVYLNNSGVIEHILFATNWKNVYLVVVFDRREKEIRGHHLLDLNEKYGLKSPLEGLE